MGQNEIDTRQVGDLFRHICQTVVRKVETEAVADDLVEHADLFGRVGLPLSGAYRDDIARHVYVEVVLAAQKQQQVGYFCAAEIARRLDAIGAPDTEIHTGGPGDTAQQFGQGLSSHGDVDLGAVDRPGFGQPGQLHADPGQTLGPGGRFNGGLRSRGNGQQ